MPDRDATLDAFVTPDDEPDDGAADDVADDVADDPVDGSTNGPADEPADKTGEYADATQKGDDEPVVGGDEPTAGDGTPAADSADQDEGTDRAVTTFAWSPDGTACESCGASVARRWRTDAGFVCADCVDWERTPNE